MLRKYSKYLGILLAVFISVLIFVFREKFMALKEYGYLGVFLLSVVGNATIILPAPVIVTVFVAGSLFNPVLVAIISSLGAAIGELTGYLAGVSGRHLIEEKQKEKIGKIDVWMKKYGLWTVFALAVIPNPFFDLAGIVAGASKIPVWKYFLVVWSGKGIRYLAIAYLGAGSVGFLEKYL